MGKATEFKFDRYIHSDHPKKIFVNFRKKGAWAYPGMPSFLSTPVISGMGKATNF